MSYRISIAQDLREIGRMYGNLHHQAHADADNPEIPGGDAMVMLGPGADIEAFGYMQLSALMGRIEADSVALDAIEPPLSFLASWVDSIREQRGQDASERRATIQGELLYLSKALDWMTQLDEDGAPWWVELDDFATQLHNVRKALERVLHDGEQRDIGGAPCLTCGSDLLKIWGIDPGTDRYRCHTCERWYTVTEYDLAVHQAYLVNAEWLTANQMAAVYRVPPGTIVSWAGRAQIRKRLDPNTGRTQYSVDDVKTRREATV